MKASNNLGILTEAALRNKIINKENEYNCIYEYNNNCISVNTT